jgi:amino-acid N-acetyltransferase
MENGAMAKGDCDEVLSGLLAIRSATAADVPLILRLLSANANDTSLFQQPELQVQRTFRDFVLAFDQRGTVVGCAALHWHSDRNAEILAVAVEPERHSRGVGSALMRVCLQLALDGRVEFLWLATAKPDYFARFGFHVTARWRLPPLILLSKLRRVLQQPIPRWLPALLGRHTFMRWKPAKPAN